MIIIKDYKLRLMPKQHLLRQWKVHTSIAFRTTDAFKQEPSLYRSYQSKKMCDGCGKRGDLCRDDTTMKNSRRDTVHWMNGSEN